MARPEQVPGTSVQIGDAPEGGAGRSRPVRPDRLPVSELAYDKPAAPSPFGDDVEFPLPVSELRYTHTTAP